MTKIPCVLIFDLSPGTHDVQNVKAVSSNRGQIDISGSYLPGSIDKGFFTIVYSSMTLSDIIYRVAFRDGLESMTNLSISNFQDEMYKLVVYDLMGSTTVMPEVMPAATPQSVNMDDQLNNGLGKANL